MRRGNSPISTGLSCLLAVLTATARNPIAWRGGRQGRSADGNRRKVWPSRSGAWWSSRISRGFGRKVSGAQRGEEPYLGVFNSVALIVSLLGSAYLAAEASAGRTPAFSAWCALVPVFVSVLVLTPVRAFAAGLLWGAAVFLIHAAESFRGVAGDFPLSWSSLLVIAALPAAYAGVASALTRRIGFSPLVLAVGWLLVELVASTTTTNGILHVPFAESAALNWLAHTLGSVFIGFTCALKAGLIVTVTERLLLAIGLLRDQYVLNLQVSLLPQVFPFRVGPETSWRKIRAPPPPL